MSLARSCGPRFLCGVSPNFAGLHDFKFNGTLSYDVHPHHCIPHNLGLRPRADRKQTIVIPSQWPECDRAVGMVVHEVAHTIDFETSWSMAVPDTTSYSTTDRFEAFAEGLEILICRELDAYRHWDDRVEAPDFGPLRDLVGYR